MTQQIVGQGDKFILDPERQFSCAACRYPYTLEKALAAVPRCFHCKVIMCSFCGCSDARPCIRKDVGACSWEFNNDLLELVLERTTNACDFCAWQIAEQLFYQTGRLIVDEFGDLD